MTPAKRKKLKKPVPVRYRKAAEQCRAVLVRTGERTAVFRVVKKET